MYNEYIIINKTTIQKRIAELKRNPILFQWEHNIETHNGHSPQQREEKNKIDLELNTLDDILSDSVLLLPEIEKAFEAGRKLSVDGFEEEDEKDYRKFISQLKLPI